MWYTTEHLRRDAQRQGRLLDKQSSKQVTGYECFHCGAAFAQDMQCPRCGAFEAKRVVRKGTTP